MPDPAAAMEQKINDKAPDFTKSLTKISQGTLDKFNFSWNELYEPKRDRKIKFTIPGASQDFNPKHINLQKYFTKFKNDGLDDLKVMLKLDFPLVASGTIDGITEDGEVGIKVDRHPGFQANLADKIKTAVTTNKLLEIDEIAPIDPFIYRSEIQFQNHPPSTMQLDFQHADDWPGYVTKTKEIGGQIDA